MVRLLINNSSLIDNITVLWVADTQAYVLELDTEEQGDMMAWEEES